MMLLIAITACICAAVSCIVGVWFAISTRALITEHMEKQEDTPPEKTPAFPLLEAEIEALKLRQNRLEMDSQRYYKMGAQRLRRAEEKDAGYDDDEEELTPEQLEEGVQAMQNLTVPPQNNAQPVAEKSSIPFVPPSSRGRR